MGFPSPASDYVEGRIDLNKVLMPHPTHMLMIETPVGFAIVDRTIQGKTGDKVAFQLGDYSQLGQLFSSGIITSDGETIDGEGMDGIIVLGKVTAEVLAVYEPCRPII
ncbi:phage repressor protein [Enterobacteriaceae bacterium EKM102V]|uniref:phage repressor protein n=1 Tax=Pantoea TaxID=53335 RepID=UPI00142E1A7A|nr:MULTISPECIES: phage repressor protein [Pantoea]KAF6661244.1 phage repressor protein [Enterobacteriaceae bacterium EKM102V]KAF6668246.1 phage repressor protein [Pantoea sp. EKM103V]